VHCFKWKAHLRQDITDFLDTNPILTPGKLYYITQDAYETVKVYVNFQQENMKIEYVPQKSVVMFLQKARIPEAYTTYFSFLYKDRIITLMDWQNSIFTRVYK
jgi:hypothetical protein